MTQIEFEKGELEKVPPALLERARDVAERLNGLTINEAETVLGASRLLMRNELVTVEFLKCG